MKKIFFSLIIISSLVFFFGCAVIDITVDLQNPYLITIKWDDGEIRELIPDPVTGELPIQTLDTVSAGVEAFVTDENGNSVDDIRTYDWYLNGALFTRGKKITIENTLEVGTYQLSLLVAKGSIVSSVQIQFIVIK
jgi:hypothetical protein